MIGEIKRIFDEKGIVLAEALPLGACRVTYRALLDRTLPDARTAIVFVMPYFSGFYPRRNLSLYALPKDYHLYAKELCASLCAELSALFPGASFRGCSDHSPIDERHACACAGLGLLGDNGMLITKDYGSFVFLGEILTDLPPETLGAVTPIKPKGCLHCGKCRDACPCAFTDCASGIGQKKGELTADEESLFLMTGLVWGCDRCQEVCPCNASPAETPLLFFREDLITRLDRRTLDALDKKALSARAFGWRGRKTAERNLSIWEKEGKL